MLIINYLKLSKKNFVSKLMVKFKHKDNHWSVQVKNRQSTDKALEHFDDFYKKVFPKHWSSIRQGLLSENKYVAIVNNYSDSGKTIEELENNGAINMRTLFNLEKQYIKENTETQQAQILMKKIHKIDVEMQENKTKINTKYEDKINAENEKYSKEKLVRHSLSDSLKSAEYDYSRIMHAETMGYSSVLHQFIPATKIKGKEDWISETQYYSYYDSTNSMKVPIEKEYDLHFPENLNIYCYEKSNYSRFKSPSKGSTGVLDYYLLDGGSVLPVLALGLKPRDIFLDLCGAPGGKTLIALQTLYPDKIVCNDIDQMRIKRIYNVLRQYLFDLNARWLSKGKIQVTQENGKFFSTAGFDCVLVDVPCTNDRLSVKENDNNWFKSSRTKERLQLPEEQAALLSHALKLVKIGGTVVYSTCSLSPIQNDGVVYMALRHIWEETSFKIVVKDLRPALKFTQSVFRLADENILKYGHLILPHPSQNYGPMYFCKLKRVE